MEVTRLANALGAKIRGVDISERLSQEAIKSIRLIWQEHHVIVFRDVVWSRRTNNSNLPANLVPSTDTRQRRMIN